MLVRFVLNFNTLVIKTSLKRRAQHFPPEQLWKNQAKRKRVRLGPLQLTEGAGTQCPTLLSYFIIIVNVHFPKHFLL